jgi:6-phosphogluconate dehydrogenase
VIDELVPLLDKGDIIIDGGKAHFPATMRREAALREQGLHFVGTGVMDQAEQKGTGRWTVQTALDLGVPITGIADATMARALSGSVPQREAARAKLPGRAAESQVADRDAFVEDVRQALYASKVVAYSRPLGRSWPAAPKRSLW